MNKILRLIDANLNRTLEGLRVCEDIARFILENKKLSASFKNIRQKAGSLAGKIQKEKSAVVEFRNVRKDIGKKTTIREAKRIDIAHVFTANVQRVKESLRVLEEASKLFDKKISQAFKKMRFRTYELEKKSRAELEALLHNR
ncbi:MAG: thiamine-phosphate pyrophosphorylase [Candidatus Omnitrophica bacterium]|nr:thiamine-phosphate pyrophosphorylase [Candidatus Omnitrophota bacterium]